VSEAAWPCDIRFEAPFGKSKCVTCGREWEPMTPQGSANHCVRELGSRLAAAREIIEVMLDTCGTPLIQDEAEWEAITDAAVQWLKHERGDDAMT
jgi:hypothetical protein